MLLKTNVYYLPIILFILSICVVKIDGQEEDQKRAMGFAVGFFNKGEKTTNLTMKQCVIGKNKDDIDIIGGINIQIKRGKEESNVCSIDFESGRGEIEEKLDAELSKKLMFIFNGEFLDLEKTNDLIFSQEGGYLVIGLADSLKTKSSEEQGDINTFIKEQLEKIEISLANERTFHSILRHGMSVAAMRLANKVKNYGIVVVKAERKNKPIDSSADDEKIAQIISLLDSNGRKKIINLLMGNEPKEKLTVALKEAGCSPRSTFDDLNCIGNAELEGFGKTTKDIIIWAVENMGEKEAHELLNAIGVKDIDGLSIDKIRILLEKEINQWDNVIIWFDQGQINGGPARHIGLVEHQNQNGNFLRPQNILKLVVVSGGILFLLYKLNHFFKRRAVSSIT